MNRKPTAKWTVDELNGTAADFARARAEANEILARAYATHPRSALIPARYVEAMTRAVDNGLIKMAGAHVTGRRVTLTPAGITAAERLARAAFGES